MSAFITVELQFGAPEGEGFFVGSMDLTIRVNGSVSRYYPAKTWGRPEHCHPEEGGEVEIESYELHEATVDVVEGDVPGRIRLSSASIEWLLTDEDEDRARGALFEDAATDDSWCEDGPRRRHGGMWR